MTKKYFLYARKSQERDDRQIVSLEDQIRDMKYRATQKGLHIVEIFEEAKSAKKRGRPVFNRMIKRIKNGEVEGVLCWKLNRLARNSFDGGEITDLLQQKVIKCIETFDRGYYPEDNVMYMMIEFGMATQYSKDLSGVVSRGLRAKAIERKWYPLPVLPVGYMHYTNPETLVKSIIIDKVRFYKMKELWKLFLTGAYSIAEIKQQADFLELKNRKGKKYSQTSLKRYFTNSFYVGYFFWNNENGERVRVDGKHKQMITQAQFKRAQELLGEKGRDTRSSEYNYAYRGILRCGECEGVITAERKYRATCTRCKSKFSILHKQECKKCGMLLSEMKEPHIFDQTYYHCIRYTNPNCSQKAMTEIEIEKTILKELELIEIDDQMYKWLKDKSKLSQPKEEHHILLNSLRNKKRNQEDRIAKLVDMRVNEEISVVQFNVMVNRYEDDLKDTVKEIERRETELKNWNDDASEYLNLAHRCVKRFKSSSGLEKKAFIRKFFSNPKILNKTLYFSTKKAPLALSLVE